MKTTESTDEILAFQERKKKEKSQAEADLNALLMVDIGPLLERAGAAKKLWEEKQAEYRPEIEIARQYDFPELQTWANNAASELMNALQAQASLCEPTMSERAYDDAVKKLRSLNPLEAVYPQNLENARKMVENIESMASAMDQNHNQILFSKGKITVAINKGKRGFIWGQPLPQATAEPNRHPKVNTEIRHG